MTYTAQVTLKFDSEWKSPSYSYVTDETMLPEEHVTMECPAHDLNTTQYFRLFRNFLLAIGMDDANIVKGAVSLGFNEEHDYEQMRRIAEEFDLVLNEDVAKRVEEKVKEEKEIDEEWARIQKNSDKIDALTKENFDLKAKLSRLENPDNPNYTDAEIAAMTYESR
jgi:hypothetical protein